MRQRLEVRDPIHGFVYREPEERDVMDTCIFQRLRRLRQLALASLVYPGATHSRFEHSLGAFHLAGKIASALDVDASETRLLKLAALLHDIGHGPFSHVIETILDFHHEQFTIDAVLSNETEVGRLLSGFSPELANRFREVSA